MQGRGGEVGDEAWCLHLCTDGGCCGVAAWLATCSYDQGVRTVASGLDGGRQGGEGGGGGVVGGVGWGVGYGSGSRSSCTLNVANVFF